jgi:3-oxoacyl-[acyl-carrier-protein] synthase III
MKIESVKVGLPSRLVTNEDIIGFIERESAHLNKEDLRYIMKKTEVLLRASGSKNRFWRTENETPLEILKNAFNKALGETNWNKEDIDLLIYVGVGRGFVEPGGSYITAKALGLSKAHCFDVVDACMSWSRAVQIVHSFFKLGLYKRVAIVNAEFNIYEYFYPKLSKLNHADELDHIFPAYTVGEAATITFLSNTGENRNWEFYFSSRPDLADLCTIPNKNFQSFCENGSGKIGRNGHSLFTSYGIELHDNAESEAVDIINKLSIPKDKVDIVFTHASSSTMWGKWGKIVGLADKIYHIFPRTGNLVSASIPATMALALEEGKLNRGDEVVLWIGSAGMSFSAFNFIY